MPSPRVAVLGAGAVGGFVGAQLTHAGLDVRLVARGAHLDALRSAGLRLRGPDGERIVPVTALEHLSEAGVCDAVLVTVKSYDTAAVAGDISPALAGDGVVVSLQNGVDNETVLAAAVGAERVAAGVAYVFATVSEPGVVEHRGAPRLVVGPVQGTPGAALTGLVDSMRGAGLDVELTPRARAVLWEKFAFICAVAGLTGTTRLPMGVIRSSPAAWRMLGAIVAEVLAVARAEGVEVGGDVAERLVATAAGLDPGARSSLHDDLVGGRRIELEALHGAVVHRARGHGVAAPMCEAVHAILQPWWQEREPDGRSSP